MEILFIVLVWIWFGIQIIIGGFALLYIIFGYKRADYDIEVLRLAMRGRGAKNYIEYKAEVIGTSLRKIFLSFAYGAFITFLIKLMFQFLTK